MEDLYQIQQVYQRRRTDTDACDSVDSAYWKLLLKEAITARRYIQALERANENLLFSLKRNGKHQEELLRQLLERV